DFVPAPSACIMAQYSGSPVSISGIILQEAFGKRPLSMFLMALCTSSFEADTPRCKYLFSMAQDGLLTKLTKALRLGAKQATNSAYNLKLQHLPWRRKG